VHPSIIFSSFSLVDTSQGQNTFQQAVYLLFIITTFNLMQRIGIITDYEQ
jgi:hypothetical protein